MRREKADSVTSFLALTVLGIFALCLLLVLLYGAGSYRSMVLRDRQDHLRRTAAQYLTMRVQQGDAEGCLWVEDFSGCPALTVAEQIGGQTYLTRVYCYDGWLRELLCPEGSGLAPADGEKLLPCQALDFQRDGTLLTAWVTLPDGQQVEVRLTLTSGREVSHGQ